MFHSLKGKNYIRISGQRRCMKFVPARSGREESLPSTDEGELAAISRATRHGNPIYLVRSSTGNTLDVLLDKASALRTRDVIRERMHFSGPTIHVYERHNTALVRL